MKNLEIYPLITEKSAGYGDHSTYVFKAKVDYDKTMVKKFIEDKFSVRVLAVRSAIFSRKTINKRNGKVNSNYFKKLYVKIESGKKIPLFEGV